MHVTKYNMIDIMTHTHIFGIITKYSNYKGGLGLGKRMARRD